MTKRSILDAKFMKGYKKTELALIGRRILESLKGLLENSTAATGRVNRHKKKSPLTHFCNPRLSLTKRSELPLLRKVENVKLKGV